MAMLCCCGLLHWLTPPARVANLGPKVIYYYSGMKVVFKNGVVSDVEQP
jgi:hypothetical protein